MISVPKHRCTYTLWTCCDTYVWWDITVIIHIYCEIVTVCMWMKILNDHITDKHIYCEKAHSRNEYTLQSVTNHTLPRPNINHSRLNPMNYHTRPIVSRGADDVYESPLGDSRLVMNIHNPFMHCATSQYVFKPRDVIMLMRAVTIVAA